MTEKIWNTFSEFSHSYLSVGDELISTLDQNFKLLNRLYWISFFIQMLFRPWFLGQFDIVVGKRLDFAFTLRVHLMNMGDHTVFLVIRILSSAYFQRDMLNAYCRDIYSRVT